MVKPSLIKFAWLSVFAAVLTILLKSAAYLLTGSVGLLSDALESVVNLAAAFMALFILKIAEKPSDRDHAYGHTKAEYFSSIVEGGLIFVAAIGIITTSMDRIMHPRPIEHASVGLIISTLASLINLIVGQILIRTGKSNHSIVLEADGHHLMTDVLTSAGVILGIVLVSVTGVQIIDPLVALCVAINIIAMGIRIMRDSVSGLMDTALPDQYIQKIEKVLKEYQKIGVSYHGLRSRRSATRSFMSVHILVPGSWSVQKGHDLLEDVETKLHISFPNLFIETHLEPLEDPRSQNDISLER